MAYLPVDPPFPFNVHALADVVRDGGEEAVRDVYPAVYGSGTMDPETELRFVRHLREHGMSRSIIAAVLGLQPPATTRRLQVCGAVEPAYIMGEDGTSRPNRGHTGQPPVAGAPPVPARGRPVEPRADLLLRDAQVLARRMDAVARSQARQDMDPARQDEVTSLLEGILRGWGEGHA